MIICTIGGLRKGPLCTQWVQLQNYTLQQCSQEENSASQYYLRAGLVSSLRVLIGLGLYA